MGVRRTAVTATILQLLRYGGVAGGVALFYLGVFAVLLLTGLHYFVAILIAQVIAIAVAFPLYRRFVFESVGRLHGDLLRFLGVWTGGAIAGLVATPLMVELVGIDPFIAQVIAIVVVSVASFLGHRFFSFRRSAVQQQAAPTAGQLVPERDRQS